MSPLRIALAFFIGCASVFAQIEVADSTVDHKPLTAKLILGVEDSSDATVTWTADAGTSFVPSSEKFGLALWASPGEHWLKASATVVHFETLEVFVPDQQDPKNPAKAKLKTVKIFVSSRVVEFPVKTFRVTGPKADDVVTPITPKPTDVVIPNPTPNPTPYPDSPLGLVRIAASNAPAGRSIEASLIAKAHQNAVSAAQSNRFLLIDQLEKQISQEIQAGIPLDRQEAWRPWQTAIKDQMKSLEAAGKLDLRDDRIAAYQEIAQGLNLRKAQ